MQRSPAEPKPAEMAASAAALHVGVGQHDHVVLGPAQRLDPLAVLGRPSRRRDRAIGVLPTKDTAATPGWAKRASTATASPCTTLSTPSGTPASWASSASSSDGEGSFSEGLRTKALPQADGVGHHPERDHDGEVERRDAGHHAEGLEHGVHVDPARDLGRVRALQQVGDARRRTRCSRGRAPPLRRRRSAPCRARP